MVGFTRDQNTLMSNVLTLMTFAHSFLIIGIFCLCFHKVGVSGSDMSFAGEGWKHTV